MTAAPPMPTWRTSADRLSRIVDAAVDRLHQLIMECPDCRRPFVTDDGSGERCRCGGPDA